MRGYSSGAGARIAAAVLFAASLSAQPLQYRVLARGEGQQAVDGRLWLYVGGWGWLDRVELGRIEGGNLDVALSQASFPEKWPFAAHLGYFVALETGSGLWYRSEMLVSPYEPAEAIITRSALIKALPDLIAQLGSLQRLGSGSETLVLPAQTERRITLLHEDGKPLAGEEIEVDVFVWRQNHCGVAVGPGRGLPRGATLGVHETDEGGSFAVTAPQATLVLRRQHYPVVDSGDGAVLRREMDSIEVEPGGDVTIRSMWEAPRSTQQVSVRLVSTDGEPISGWYVTWDMNTNTCGPPILVNGPSGADGWIRFQTHAESLTREMAVYDRDVREGGPWDRALVHRFTREELLLFARDGTITLRLEKP